MVTYFVLRKILTKCVTQEILRQVVLRLSFAKKNCKDYTSWYTNCPVFFLSSTNILDVCVTLNTILRHYLQCQFLKAVLEDHVCCPIAALLLCSHPGSNSHHFLSRSSEEYLNWSPHFCPGNEITNTCPKASSDYITTVLKNTKCL